MPSKLETYLAERRAIAAAANEEPLAFQLDARVAVPVLVGMVERLVKHAQVYPCNCTDDMRRNDCKCMRCRTLAEVERMAGEAGK